MKQQSEPAGVETTGDWGERITAVVVGQILRWRLERGWSASRLAAECAALGYPVSRNTLTNLENGRRRTLSVAELLILARALDAPPVALLSPVGPAVDKAPTAGGDVEITPGVLVSAVDAVMWLMGDRARPDSSLDERFANAKTWANASRDAVWSARQHSAHEYNAIVSRRQVRDLLARDAPSDHLDAAQWDVRRADEWLLRVRGDMRQRGEVPPDLPEELAHLEPRGDE